jgi:hypothetical protein
MNTQRSVPHSFNLKGLKARESFLGCPKCWFRYDPGTAAKPVCPECRSGMRIYDMTPADVVPDANNSRKVI